MQNPIDELIARKGVLLADGATVTLEQQVALGPLLEPKPVEGPVVPAGSYIVSVRAPGRVPVPSPDRPSRIAPSTSPASSPRPDSSRA